MGSHWIELSLVLSVFADKLLQFLYTSGFVVLFSKTWPGVKSFTWTDSSKIFSSNSTHILMWIYIFSLSQVYVYSVPWCKIYFPAWREGRSWILGVQEQLFVLVASHVSTFFRQHSEIMDDDVRKLHATCSCLLTHLICDSKDYQERQKVQSPKQHWLCHLASRHTAHWMCYSDDRRSNQGILDGISQFKEWQWSNWCLPAAPCRGITHETIIVSTLGNRTVA